ncbi:nitroreductase/quinone reductase family protein [Streptomyces virginiae]|uniref:nitroreductase/quinone reductase family protein n=1 Tax=Streptomyces virginiae TaxID=1961 RepID=UPI0037A34938
MKPDDTDENTEKNTVEPDRRRRFLYFCLRRLNPFMKRLLRSRFHRLVSGNILLLTFTGRRSGRRYSTPVSYIRESGTVTFATPRACRWWVNLQGNADVTLLVAGQTLAGQVVVIEDDQDQKTASITRLLQLVPRDAPYYRIAVASDGTPDPDDLAQAAHEHIVIRVVLVEAGSGQ